MRIPNKTRSPRPIISSSQISTINKLQLVKDLVLIRIMVQSIDNDPTLPIESVRILIDIDQHDQLTHSVKRSDVLGRGVVRPTDERFAGRVNCVVEVDFSPVLVVLARRDSIAIFKVMFNEFATLTVQH